MRQMDLRALYPRRRTSQPGQGHKIYPYRLRDLSIERANQAWASDICYIPMAKGFMYLVAIMDWYSRRVLSWRVSNTLDTDFCIDALEDALQRFEAPEIFNTDQGSQFTSEAFTDVLKNHPHCDQHGWQGPVGGQCVHRAFVAQREVRRCVPARLRNPSRTTSRAGPVLRVLQLPASS